MEAAGFSFKVFYDVSLDAVRHYFFLKFAASRLFDSSGAKAVAKAWLIYRSDQLLHNRDMASRLRKRLLKRAPAKPEDVPQEAEGLGENLPGTSP